jgi:hypothetical protein
MATQYTLLPFKAENLTCSPIIITEKELAENFDCLFCYNLPIDPISCTECESLMCRYCFDAYNSKFTNCLQCNKPLKPKPLGRLLNNILINLTVKCENQACYEILKQKEYLKHYKECRYTKRMATCNACQVSIPCDNRLEEVKLHMRECLFAKKKCIYCTKEFTKDKLKGHRSKCSEKTIICDLCDSEHKLKDSKNHVCSRCLEEEYYYFNKFNFK